MKTFEQYTIGVKGWGRAVDGSYTHLSTIYLW
jgi:hypothetical protein